MLINKWFNRVIFDMVKYLFLVEIFLVMLFRIWFYVFFDVFV